MKKCNGKCSLPAFSFAINPSSKSPVLIHRGKMGYSAMPADIDVDEENEALGVSPAVAEAMLAGSMFGWHVPAADPCIYEKEDN